MKENIFIAPLWWAAVSVMKPVFVLEMRHGPNYLKDAINKIKIQNSFLSSRSEREIIALLYFYVNAVNHLVSCHLFLLDPG